MKLIAGFASIDAGPSAEAEGARLRGAVEGIGIARTSLWRGSGVCLALGTSEPVEPIAGHPGDPAGRWRIVADVRLDNRAELAAALGLVDEIADADLVLVAYRAWGRDCCAHFLGDFAFAIWDEAEATLFCARDQLGIRPFYYRRDADRLRFGSRSGPLVQPDEPLDDGRIATFLLGFEDDFADTAFAAVRRLPPGHWMLWRDGVLTLTRYWSLAADDAPVADYATTFRAQLEQSVRARLRAAEPVGAMLSGGLDSSSIVAMASVLGRGDEAFTLKTYSFAYPQAPAFDETRFAGYVRDAYPIAATLVPFDASASLDGLATLADGGDDLFFAPGMPKIARVLAAAYRGGSRIVLDGHGGDEVASHGFGRLAELATQRRWLQLYRELRGVAGIFGDRPARLWGQYFMAHGAGTRSRKIWRRLARLLGQGRDEGPKNLGVALLNKAFVARSGIAERRRAWADAYAVAGTDEARLHAYNLTSPAIARSFETLSRIADRNGVELRFPFFDRRLVGFALSVPDSEKLRDGWTRSVLRRAMQDILPPEVQWRRDKIDFAPELAAALAGPGRKLLDGLFADGGPLEGYVDLMQLRSHFHRLVSAPDRPEQVDLFAIWRCAFLGLWLGHRRAVQRPMAAVVPAREPAETPGAA